MMFGVWLDAIDLGDFGVLASSKQVKPLSVAGSNVKNDTFSILQQRFHGGFSLFGRKRTEPSPESSKPCVLKGAIRCEFAEL